MSISKLSKIAPGCVYVISGLLLLGFGGSMFLRNSAVNQRNPGDQQLPLDTTPQVAQIGDFVITAGGVNEGQAKQGDVSLPRLPASLGGALFNQVQQGYAYRVMRDEGIHLTDAEIVTSKKAQIATIIQQARNQFVQEKLIDAKASDADVKDQIKKRGMDVDQELATLQQSIKDPSRHPQVEFTAGIPQLRDKIKSEIKVSDEELKHDFDSLELKRVSIELGGAKTPFGLATDVLRQIKGGLSFEAAMDKYPSADPEDRPDKGKKASDKVLTKLRKDLAPEVRTEVDKLKPGEVSAVIPTPTGASIYKLISSKPQLPKDFDKTKDVTRKSYQEAHASQVFEARFQALKDKHVLQWLEPSFEALYRLYELQDDPKRQPDPKKDPIELKAILALLAKSTATDETVLRVAGLTKFGAFEALYSKSSPDEQKKMSDDRIEVLTKALEFSEDVATRLDLAELLLAKKDGKGAGQNLVLAAQRSVNDMQDLVSSMTVESRIEGITAKMSLAALLTDDVKKQLDDARKNFTDQRNAMLESQKKDEAERLKSLAEQTKAEEEQKKAAELQRRADELKKKKTVPTPRVGPSPGPTAQATPSPSSSPSSKPSTPPKR